MSSSAKLGLERRESALWIWLDRPDVHNAFDAELIALLSESLAKASQDPELRVIVLAGRGRSFSAGADLNWMKRAAELSETQNREDAGRLAAMLRTLERSPKATIARVQGAALGGGLGLVAACDIAIAASRAKFGFSEVKLGLIPAVISPHVIQKIGPGKARALFLTGGRFDAQAAERLGLINQVTSDEATLDQAVEETIEELLSSAPVAIAEAKELVRSVSRLAEHEVDSFTAGRIAARRASLEAREGISAFLEKRPPSWIRGGSS